MFAYIDFQDEKSRSVQQLVHNYRAVPSIADFYSGHFYDSRLVPTVSGENSREAAIIRQLQEFLPCNKNKSFGLHFVDVHEGISQRIRGEKSYMNCEEAFAVIFYYRKYVRVSFLLKFYYLFCFFFRWHIC